MRTLQKYNPFFASALLLYLVLFIIYPHYQYYIDPDGTAYLTISKRYAAGDIQRAVNGYWSPWACWLTAGLIKMGLAPIPASVIINALGATGFLFISQSFFLRCGIIKELKWLLCITLALFLSYAIFWQSFDDLWMCFFLLVALRLLLVKTFHEMPAYWAFYGIMGALAYFAKAYAFPFFIISAFFCTLFASRDAKNQAKIFVTGIGIMLLISLPWIIALHHKYGIWTTSTAGSLNMSWYLVGHPYWKDGIHLLIPPAYPDSPYYWEDPYLANGITPHFWNSFSLFGLQILRIGQNIMKLLLSMGLVSILSPLVFREFFLVVLSFFKLKNLPDNFPWEILIMGISLLLFLSGYMLINFESRYIWYSIPLIMVLGALQIQNARHASFRNILIVAFPLTFLIYPVNRMETMYDEGKAEYNIAIQLRELNIHGTFTYITKPGRDAQRIERLAYFSGNQLYSIPDPDANPKDVLAEMRYYHVKYYFAYNIPANENFTDEHGNSFPELTHNSIQGLKVFLVNP